MSRDGSDIMGLLHGLHSDQCDGTEHSTCRPVVVPAYEDADGAHAPSIEVVYMEWCGECGAADWEVV